MFFKATNHIHFYANLWTLGIKICSIFSIFQEETNSKLELQISLQKQWF